MKPIQESSHEHISALADGALQGDAMAHAVDALCTDPAMQQVWRDHHLVGDVLRAGARRPCTDTMVFLSRFQQRLAADVSLTPIERIEPMASVLPFPARQPAKVATATLERIEAANEPVFRWKLVSGVASLAAVAAIGWNLAGGAGSSMSDVNLARQQMQQPVQTAAREAAPVLAAVQPASTSSPAGPQSQESTRVLASGGEPQVMLRDARLDQLLEAHRQAGGAAQMPSGFLRNATFDGPSR